MGGRHCQTTHSVSAQGAGSRQFRNGRAFGQNIDAADGVANWGGIASGKHGLIASEPPSAYVRI